MIAFVAAGQVVARAGDPVSPSILHQRVFAPYKLAILVDVAAQRGFEPNTVLKGTELSSAKVHDPHTLISVHDCIVALENVVAAGAQPSLALDVGSRMHLSAYGMYGYALMCSPTMRDFCDAAVRYHLLATPLLRLAWSKVGSHAVWEFQRIPGIVMSGPAHDFLIRQQMMMTATHVRDMAGLDEAPLHARFGIPAADDADELAQRLGCPCSFGHVAHQLCYPADLLDRAPPFANRLTYAWLEETCADLIGRTHGAPSLAGDIYQQLMCTPQHAPTMTQIAREKGITERTLRRRLAAEGVSFANIEDEVRRRLTLGYLATTRMSADDIAAMVGFSDSSNLRRAVKRWTGRTFADVRANG